MDIAEILLDGPFVASRYGSPIQALKFGVSDGLFIKNEVRDGIYISAAVATKAKVPVNQ